MHCLLYFSTDIRINEIKFSYFLTDIIRNNFYNLMIDYINHAIYVYKFLFFLLENYVLPHN